MDSSDGRRSTEGESSPMRPSKLNLGNRSYADKNSHDVCDDIEIVLMSPEYRHRLDIDDIMMTKIKQRTSFSEKDLGYLLSNFKKIAPKNVMNFKLWRQGLGILNTPKADYLTKAMFKAIDTDKDGYVCIKCDRRCSLKIMYLLRMY